MKLSPKSLLLAASILASTMLAPGTARAQSTVTEVQSFSDLEETSSDSSEPVPTFTFAGFDSSLGTLTSIQIGMTNFQLGATITGTNNSAVTETISNMYGSGYYEVTDNFGTGGSNYEYLTAGGTPTNTDTLSMGGSYNPTYAPNNVQLQVNTNESGSYTNVTPGSMVSSGPLVGNQSGASTQFVGTANWSNYEGTTATVTLNLYPASGATGSFYASHGGSSAEFSFDTLLSGTVEIIYTYTPVPEPRQAAGLLIGFGLCLLIGRKFLRARSSLKG